MRQREQRRKKKGTREARLGREIRADGSIRKSQEKQENVTRTYTLRRKKHERATSHLPLVLYLAKAPRPDIRRPPTQLLWRDKLWKTGFYLFLHFKIRLQKRDKRVAINTASLSSSPSFERAIFFFFFCVCRRTKKKMK